MRRRKANIFPNIFSVRIFAQSPIVSSLPCCFPCAAEPQNMRPEPGISQYEALLRSFGAVEYDWTGADGSSPLQ